ncbi:MAG: hypothetical protein KC502_13945, partial [Myxococcales bacterium]|nr:hypothetical protein [Myxococcales bacterium]
RWMGLGKACVNCHKNPHKPTLGPDCQSCHSETKFAPAPRFSHDKARFRLRGRHKDVPCAKCHTKGGKRGQYRGLSFSSCVSCHSDPVPNHSRGKGCDDCHTESSWRRAKKGAGRRLHGLLSFKLTHGHAQPACAQCHEKRRRMPKTPIKRLHAFQGLEGACVSCHKDPHKRRLGQRCERCHTTVNWKAAVRKSQFDHRRTAFALKGRHQDVRCERCHKPAGNYAGTYTRIAHERCVDCHKDVHTGTFKTVSDSNRCEDCHTERGFVPANFAASAHDKADMKLAGAHRVVPCQQCHTQGPIAGADDRDGSSAQVSASKTGQRKAKRRRKRRRRGLRRVHARSPRNVARLIGTPQACKDCHTNPHGTQFQGRSPALECSSCHTDKAFVPATRFDHDKTKFQLKGPHKEAACADCHLKAKPKSPITYAGVKTTCASCHRDSHAGQFRQGGKVKTCEDCHTLVKDFRIAKFDHDQTRFPLRGKHQKADCARCHTKVKVGQTEVIHYRLGPMACEKCHQNPHGQRAQSTVDGAGSNEATGAYPQSWLPGSLSVFSGLSPANGLSEGGQ